MLVDFVNVCCLCKTGVYIKFHYCDNFSVLAGWREWKRTGNRQMCITGTLPKFNMRILITNCHPFQSCDVGSKNLVLHKDKMYFIPNLPGRLLEKETSTGDSSFHSNTRRPKKELSSLGRCAHLFLEQTFSFILSILKRFWRLQSHQACKLVADRYNDRFCFEVIKHTLSCVDYPRYSV